MSNKIQRVELNKFYNASIHCPFCGVKIIDTEAAESGADPTNPCPHTLFVAHDEGFEYWKDRQAPGPTMPVLKEEIVELVPKRSGLTDREITVRLRGRQPNLPSKNTDSCLRISSKSQGGRECER